QKFAGVGIKDLFEVLIITGSFACALAFWNTSNRYLFSMGRERILPRILGRTHASHKSPFVATVIVLVFCLVGTTLFATGAIGGQLTTGARKGWAFQVPFYALGIFSAGLLLGLIYYLWSRQRYEAIGRFVHEEA